MLDENQDVTSQSSSNTQTLVMIILIGMTQNL